MIKIGRPPCPNAVALKNNYKHPDNKESLREAGFDKCMYCESKISQTYHGDIEHIKPKSKFPALEFVWENLGYVCAKCNGIKGHKHDDTTSFINPYEEDPTEHVTAGGAILLHKCGSERGEVTISEELGIGLNRVALIQRRQERIDSIQKAVDSCFRTRNASLKSAALEALKDEANSDKEYSLCIQIFLKSHGIL